MSKVSNWTYIDQKDIPSGILKELDRLHLMVKEDEEKSIWALSKIDMIYNCLFKGARIMASTEGKE